MNISDWRRNGYQKHLAQQERLTVHANREAAHAMVAENDTTSLAEGALQMLSSQYFDIIGDFSTSALKEKLQDDPLKYSRFLNVFARLTREIVNLKKQREAAPQAAPAELPQLDEDRKLNENEQNLIQDRWDQCFKIHPNHLRSKSPITPVQSSSFPQGKDDVPVVPNIDRTEVAAEVTRRTTHLPTPPLNSNPTGRGRCWIGPFYDERTRKKRWGLVVVELVTERVVPVPLRVVRVVQAPPRKVSLYSTV